MSFTCAHNSSTHSGCGRGLTGYGMTGTGVCLACKCGLRWGGRGMPVAGIPGALTPMPLNRRNHLRSTRRISHASAQRSYAERGMLACEHAAREARLHFAARYMPTQDHS